MRATLMNPGSKSDQRHALKPGALSAPRPPRGSRARGPQRPGARPWLRGLRWVPVPLAVLAAVIGALVMGSFQGQQASANAHQTGYRAGGLALSVDTMAWMMNMTPTKGYQMPASMTPGMQPVGDNRLRVEVSLSDVTTDVQRYSVTDFSLSGPGGKIWKVDGPGHSDMATSAVLEPGFQTTVDLYFDIPAKKSKNLTLKWSRGGTTVSIPVNTGTAGPHSMHM
jgi:hypothetical protein